MDYGDFGGPLLMDTAASADDVTFTGETAGEQFGGALLGNE